MDRQNEQTENAWRWSWQAVLCGVATALVLVALLTWIGFEILGLPIINPYVIAAVDGSEGLLFGTVAWIVLIAIVPLFSGAFIVGNWDESSHSVSLLKGITVWGLTMALAGAGYISSAYFGRLKNAADFSVADELSQGFTALRDDQFKTFLLNLAHVWKPGKTEDAIFVSAKTDNQAKPSKIPGDPALRDFLKAHTSLSDDQIIELLSSYSNTIAIELVDARKRFEANHKVLWARQQRALSMAATITWSLIISAILTIAASLVGAHEGWEYSRRHQIRQP